MAKRNLTEEIKLTRDLNAEIQKQVELLKRGDSTYEKRQNILDDLESSLDDYNSLLKVQSDIEKEINNHMDTGHTALADKFSKEKQLTANAIKKIKVEKISNSLLQAGDDLTGGMLGNARGLVEGFKGAGMKVGLMSAGLTAAVAILISFSGKMDAIGQQFGAIGIHSSAIRGDLLGAEVEATKLGKSLEDVMASVTTMTSEFGTAFSESRKMAAGIIDTSVALGLSVTEGAQLIGTFTTISGLSTDTAHALAKQTTLLATASDVAPQQVLRDIAGSTETVAKFTDSSGENIARAAIQARKLGIDLNTAASAAESMLDFNNAVQKSMEASVLLGREINVRKLQELSLSGDLEGVAKEQRRLLGSQSDFLAMNVIQRKALAESIGLSVDQAAKMLDKQEEAITLAGQLAGQPGFDELVGEKGISTLTSLMGTLKSLGAVLTNSLGPILNFVLKLLVGIGKVLEFVLEPFNMIFSAFNTGIDNSFKAPVAMAKGGVVTKPTNAIIGEAGPEMVIPLNQVGNVVDNVSGGNIDSQAIVDAINSLKLTTKITNKELNIIMTPSNG